MAENLTLNVADGTAMHAYTAAPPPGAPRRGGVMVLQEAFGVNHHIRAVADRFAALGYLAIAPELFHRTAPGFEGDYSDFQAVMPHLRSLTDAGMAQDVRAAHAWLTGPGGVEAKRTSAVGFCMGGRVAVLASQTVALGAAASFYGGNLPALLPGVSAITAPLLVVWGGRDQHINLEQRQQFIAGLRAAGKSYVEATFGDADHGFLCDERQAFHPPSARLAWTLLREFLEQNAATA